MNNRSLIYDYGFPNPVYVKQIEEMIYMAKEEKNKPFKKFRAGGVVATIWKNKSKDKDDKDAVYYSIDIKRSYKDKDDEWQQTSSMNINDLPKVIAVSQKAYDTLIIKEEEPE